MSLRQQHRLRSGLLPSSNRRLAGDMQVAYCMDSCSANRPALVWKGDALKSNCAPEFSLSSHRAGCIPYNRVDRQRSTAVDFDFGPPFALRKSQHIAPFSAQPRHLVATRGHSHQSSPQNNSRTAAAQSGEGADAMPCHAMPLEPAPVCPFFFIFSSDGPVTMAP